MQALLPPNHFNKINTVQQFQWSLSNLKPSRTASEVLAGDKLYTQSTDGLIHTTTSVVDPRDI